MRDSGITGVDPPEKVVRYILQLVVGTCGVCQFLQIVLVILKILRRHLNLKNAFERLFPWENNGEGNFKGKRRLN